MITREELGRQAAIDGFAHEHIVCGILMKKYKNVSLVDLPLSPYDIIIVFKNPENEEIIIRAQVKTASGNQVKFVSGSRGGVDRTYKSGVKTYTQSTKTSDVIIGCKQKSEGDYELYFVPTILIELWKTKSKSLNKISYLKNNYDILEHSKDAKYILEKATEHNLF
jgi:hypothetical protein